MKKILVIEDTQSIREETVTILDFEGFDTIEAENGKIGIEKAQKFLPDLIVCDVMMPGIDGHEVFKILHATPETATIPFVFLTAKSSKSDLRQGMTLGADDYITKPFTADELVSTINTRLAKQALIVEQSEKKLCDLRANLSMSLPHELKTPLSSILGYSEFIANYSENLEHAEIVEYARLIHNSGLRLNNIIQNFLIYAQLEIIANDHDKIVLWRRELFSYSKSTIEYIAGKYAKKYERENDLTTNVTESDVNIPENNFGKILEELIDNAFKFSEAGTPVSIESVVTKEGKYQLKISNSGRGFTLEQINNIGAYQQFDREQHEQQGAGLGLTISKRMIELQGGEFRVISDPGKITTVQITLSTSA